MKLEIVPGRCTVLVQLYENNPYEQKEIDGFKLTNGEFDSPDSGNREKKEQICHAGQIVEVGPECKYSKENMDVMFDIRASRPICVKGDYYFQVAEANIIAWVGEDIKKDIFKTDIKNGN
jgi:hypothetical protein